MTAPTPGMSACFDIGDGAPCGGRWAETFATPCAWRCGGGGGGGGEAPPGLRSAVNATMATATPGMARTAASAAARTLSHAWASVASTLIEKKTLPSLAEISDNTPALAKATPRGEDTLASASRTCCCVTLTGASPRPFGLPLADVVRPHRGRRSALLLGGFVIQLDHHAIGVVDEDLPEIAARNLPRVESHPLGLKPRLHGGKTPAHKGDVMDHTGIRLLRLLGRGNIDQMDHRLALAVHPGAGKGKIRPIAFFEAEHIFVKMDGIGKISGPDIEMVKYAHAHGHMVSLPFVLNLDYRLMLS